MQQDSRQDDVHDVEQRLSSYHHIEAVIGSNVFQFFSKIEFL